LSRRKEEEAEEGAKARELVGRGGEMGSAVDALAISASFGSFHPFRTHFSADFSCAQGSGFLSNIPLRKFSVTGCVYENVAQNVAQNVAASNFFVKIAT
jgi:superoxide dismutase